MNASDLIGALKQVPETRLRLIELARQVVREDGSLDGERASFLVREMQEAIAEAEGYARATQEAVRCLREMARS